MKNALIAIIILISFIVFCLPCVAQDKKAETTQTDAEKFARFQQYFDSLIRYDWAWQSRYADDNAKLKATTGNQRVVFMGNSITEGWKAKDSAFFSDNSYICRGIGGQVSSQMLVRFRDDVINLKPAVVVIEAGTNDIAENRGHVSIEQTYGYIISMIELARANGIIPVIGAVLPASEFPWHKGLEPAEKIVALNAMLQAYAKQNKLAFVDYWTATANGKKGMKEDLTTDGYVHPNLAGYKVMEPLVKAAIAKATGHQ